MSVCRRGILSSRNGSGNSSSRGTTKLKKMIWAWIHRFEVELGDPFTQRMKGWARRACLQNVLKCQLRVSCIKYEPLSAMAMGKMPVHCTIANVCAILELVSRRDLRETFGVSAGVARCVVWLLATMVRFMPNTFLYEDRDKKDINNLSYHGCLGGTSICVCTKPDDHL